MIMVHRHHIRNKKEEWKTALEINMLVKMINVMTGRKLNRTDSYLLQLIIHVLNLLKKLSFFLSAFTVSRSYKNILSQNSQSTRRSLYIRGLNSAWSWIFFPNWINGWVLMNKGSEYPSLCLLSVYTEKLSMEVASYST